MSVEALADIVLPDADGRDVRLGDLWQDRMAALAWLRHYGWLHCRDHAVQLHRAGEELAEAGADLVLIGQATPQHAAHFRRKLGLDGTPLLADEERGSYKAASLRIGSATDLLGPRSALSALKRTATTGVVQGRPIGNIAQLGGAMVIRPGGAVAYTHVAQHAGDNTSVDDLLAAAREV